MSYCRDLSGFFMSSPARSVEAAALQAEKIAALEREVAELRRQLAMVSQATDHLAIATSDDPEPCYSEARYRALIELSPQVVWMTDAQGANTYCNRYWYDFSGLTPEKTVGWGWVDAVHPDDVAQATRGWRNA